MARKCASGPIVGMLKGGAGRRYSRTYIFHVRDFAFVAEGVAHILPVDVGGGTADLVALDARCREVGTVVFRGFLEESDGGEGVGGQGEEDTEADHFDDDRRVLGGEVLDGGVWAWIGWGWEGRVGHMRGGRGLTTLRCGIRSGRCEHLIGVRASGDGWKGTRRMEGFYPFSFCREDVRIRISLDRGTSGHTTRCNGSPLQSPRLQNVECAVLFDKRSCGYRLGVKF